MSKQVLRRRGTTAQNNAFRGAAGEITVDTVLGRLRVHDGVATGGFDPGRVPVSQCIYLDVDGDDDTGAPNDMTRPYHTAQGAWDAALALVVDSGYPVIVNVGAGIFANIVSVGNASASSAVWWFGLGPTVSIIGDVTNSAVDGAGAANDLNLKSNGSVYFASVTSNGGADPTTPGAGGNITLTGVYCGNSIISQAGLMASTPFQNRGGVITLTSCTVQGSVTTYGGSIFAQTDSKVVGALITGVPQEYDYSLGLPAGLIAGGSVYLADSWCNSGINTGLYAFAAGGVTLVRSTINSDIIAGVYHTPTGFSGGIVPGACTADDCIIIGSVLTGSDQSGDGTDNQSGSVTMNRCKVDGNIFTASPRNNGYNDITLIDVVCGGSVQTADDNSVQYMGQIHLTNCRILGYLRTYNMYTSAQNISAFESYIGGGIAMANGNTSPGLGSPYSGDLTLTRCVVDGLVMLSQIAIPVVVPPANGGPSFNVNIRDSKIINGILVLGSDLIGSINLYSVTMVSGGIIAPAQNVYLNCCQITNNVDVSDLLVGGTITGVSSTVGGADGSSGGIGGAIDMRSCFIGSDVNDNHTNVGNTTLVLCQVMANVFMGSAATLNLRGTHIGGAMSLASGVTVNAHFSSVLGSVDDTGVIFTYQTNTDLHITA